MENNKRSKNWWKYATVTLVLVVALLGSCFACLYQPSGVEAQEPYMLDVSIDGPAKIGANTPTSYKVNVEGAVGEVRYSWSINPQDGNTRLYDCGATAGLTFTTATSEPYSLECQVHDAAGNFGVASISVSDPPTYPNLYLGVSSAPYSYMIKADGTGWCYAINGDTNQVEFTSTNKTAIVSQVVTAIGSNSGSIVLMNIDYPYGVYFPSNVIVTQNNNGVIKQLNKPNFGLLSRTIDYGQQGLNIHLRKYGYVLTAGTVGQWDSGFIEIPTVFWDPTRQTWAMLYAGYDGTYEAVGLAFSPDLMHWTKYPSNPVFTRAVSGWDGGGVKMGSVWYENGLFYLFYIGHNQTGMEGGTNQMGLASSPDLITWTRLNSNQPIVPISSVSVGDAAWRSTQVYHPDIVQANGLYYMFLNAANQNGQEHIGYATASIITGPWTVQDANSPILEWGTDGAWDDALQGDPALMYMNSTWYMFYYGFNGSISQDGYAYTSNINFPLGWTKSINNPILQVGPSGCFDSVNAAKPMPVMYNGILYYFYSPDDGNVLHRGIALAKSEDSTRYTYVVNNIQTVSNAVLNDGSYEVDLDANALGVNSPTWANYKVSVAIRCGLTTGPVTITLSDSVGVIGSVVVSNGGYQTVRISGSFNSIPSWGTFLALSIDASSSKVIQIFDASYTVYTD